MRQSGSGGPGTIGEMDGRMIYFDGAALPGDLNAPGVPRQAIVRVTSATGRVHIRLDSAVDPNCPAEQQGIGISLPRQCWTIEPPGKTAP